jgi:D-alanine-D-alanine ligase
MVEEGSPHGPGSSAWSPDRLTDFMSKDIATHPPPIFREVTVVLGDPSLSDSAKRGGQFNPEDFEAFERIKSALAELHDYRFNYLDKHTTLLADLVSARPAFVFNLCDTGFMNKAYQELHVPALLEMLQIPYSGAGPAALALCYDKALVRGIASELGIPVPAQLDLAVHAPELVAEMRFPALVKPRCADGSLGLTQGSVVHNADAANAYIDHLRRQLPDAGVLVQEFLPGREVSIGLIGNPGLDWLVLPPLEVDYSGLDPKLPRILGYESKAEPSSPYWCDIKYRPAGIDDDTRTRLTHHARRLFERLGCRDYARVDFRTDAEGTIKLLEINPNAAWCWDGKLNMMAGFAGHSSPTFLQMLLDAAQARVAASV